MHTPCKLFSTLTGFCKHGCCHPNNRFQHGPVWLDDACYPRLPLCIRSKACRSKACVLNSLSILFILFTSDHPLQRLGLRLAPALRNSSHVVSQQSLHSCIRKWVLQIRFLPFVGFLLTVFLFKCTKMDGHSYTPKLTVTSCGYLKHLLITGITYL